MPRAIPERAPHQPHLRERAWPSWCAPPGWSGARRWAPARQPRHAGRRVPGQRPDGARRRDGRNSGPADSRAVAWGRLPLQLRHGLGGAPGAPRTRQLALTPWRSGCSAPATTASSRRPRTCSTARPRPRRRLASSARRATICSSPTRTERAVGFVSGVEVTHPDKGTEMFLYELAVDEPFRRRGIGRALVERLAALAREAGCYGMWVITDDDNAAARATYEGSGWGARDRPGRGGLDLLGTGAWTRSSRRPRGCRRHALGPVPVSTSSPASAGRRVEHHDAGADPRRRRPQALR